MKRSTTPSGPEQRALPPIEVDGRAVPVMLRTSARASKLRITVRAGGVELVVPRRARLRDAHAFLDQTTPWILDRVRRIRRATDAHPGSGRLEHGGRILLRGRACRLDLVAGTARTGRIQAGPGEIRVVLPAGLALEDPEPLLEGALTRWLRTEALRDALAFVARHGPPNRLAPSAVRVKEQASRWGSCSSRGAINLNWRLVFAPPEVFEYVVVHELCHLEHPHHQPPFWRRVAELMPDYGRHRRWLREHGQRLTLRAPAPSED